MNLTQFLQNNEEMPFILGYPPKKYFVRFLILPYLIWDDLNEFIGNENRSLSFG